MQTFTQKNDKIIIIIQHLIQSMTLEQYCFGVIQFSPYKVIFKKKKMHLGIYRNILIQIFSTQKLLEYIELRKKCVAIF